LAFIGAVVLGAAAAFAYTGGWLSPERRTPEMLLAALRPPSGDPLGHRRNHVRGVCFTGTFEANGAGVAVSRAQVFAAGQYPVVGRFSLASSDPDASDATTRVRAMAIRVSPPNGQEWRSGMISAPFFPVASVEGFHSLLVASASKDPNAMRSFASAHPEIGAFGAWAGSAPWTASYAEERYNGLNAFILSDASGTDHPVRWSMLPAAQPVTVSPGDLAARGANFLEQDLRDRVAKGPLRWTLVMTLANPDDPTSDPSKAWPDDRRAVPVGTLTVQQIVAEADGPCRDVNFDPAVLPDGMRTSDDPFPAARSSVYAKSYDARTAEAGSYPHGPAGASQ
jgi:catalase